MLNSLTCPITHLMFRDPVMASDGYTYERSAIEKWLSTSEKSPITGIPLNTRFLLSNHCVRSVIEEMNPGSILEDVPKTDEHKTEEVDEADEHFPLTRTRISALITPHFQPAPTQGSTFYGLCEQAFMLEFSSTLVVESLSRWTMKLAVEYFSELHVAATLTWRKHEQVFDPPVLDFGFASNEEAVATARRLQGTVGGMFTTRTRGRYNATIGKVYLEAYDSPLVGNGTYCLLLGDSGKAMDGCFFLRHKTEGMAVFRLRKSED